MKLAITGHRPPRLGGYHIPNPVYNAVVRALDESLINLHPDEVWIGMALGTDQWAAQLCINNEIPFVACIPFKGYEAKWLEESKLQYQLLLNHAAKIITVTETGYAPHLIDVRNQYLVSHTDQLLAVWDQAPSGTGNTVRMAQHIGKPVNLVQLPDEIWRMAKDGNDRIEELRKLRERDRERRAQQDADRRERAEAAQQELAERHRRLNRTASQRLEEERKERQEALENERQEREAILKAREEARLAEIARKEELKRRAIERELQRRAEEEQRKLEEEEAERRAEIAHGERLKPKRVIDI